MRCRIFLRDLLEASHTIAIHRASTCIQPHDIRLALNVRGQDLENAPPHDNNAIADASVMANISGADGEGDGDGDHDSDSDSEMDARSLGSARGYVGHGVRVF